MRHMFIVVAAFLLFCQSCFAESIVSAGITLEEATQRIIEGTYNKVLSTQTESVNGKTVYIIKVLTPDGRIQYFKIDAETGQLIG